MALMAERISHRCNRVRPRCADRRDGRADLYELKAAFISNEAAAWATSWRELTALNGLIIDEQGGSRRLSF
jgi:hypothetical protein